MPHSVNTPSSPRRVMLKVTGEVFGDESRLDTFVRRLAALTQHVQVALVVGGGNVFRGRSARFQKASRVLTDHIGMCASLTNALLCAAHLSEEAIATQVCAPFVVPGVVQRFDEAAVECAFAERRVVIFAGGVGEPYFSTDAAAVLNALKTRCDLLLKGTKVDGIYTACPQTHKNAAFLPHIHYDFLVREGFDVLEAGAVLMAQTANLEMRVFNVFACEQFQDILTSEGRFTRIDQWGERDV